MIDDLSSCDDYSDMGYNDMNKSPMGQNRKHTYKMPMDLDAIEEINEDIAGSQVQIPVPEPVKVVPQNSKNNKKEDKKKDKKGWF